MRASSGHRIDEMDTGIVSAKGAAGTRELDGETEKPAVPRRETMGASGAMLRVGPPRSNDSGVVAVAATGAAEGAPEGGGADCVVRGKTGGGPGAEDRDELASLELTLPGATEGRPTIDACVTRFSVSSWAAVA